MKYMRVIVPFKAFSVCKEVRLNRDDNILYACKISNKLYH